jgi:hypothetical protein
MEETGTTIHSASLRRNNFLRENPQVRCFAPSRRRISRRDQPYSRMRPQDPARTPTARWLQWTSYPTFHGAPR